MTTNTKSRIRKDYYLELVKSFPLKRIRTDAEYVRAGTMLAKLAVRPEGSLNVGEQDYMETLIILIESYDAKNVMLNPLSTPLESLRYLMEHTGLKPVDIARIIGSQPATSMILNGHRQMSKSQILSLATYFKLSPSYFM